MSHIRASEPKFTGETGPARPILVISKKWKSVKIYQNCFPVRFSIFSLLLLFSLYHSFLISIFLCFFKGLSPEQPRFIQHVHHPAWIPENKTHRFMHLHPWGLFWIHVRSRMKSTHELSKTSEQRLKKEIKVSGFGSFNPFPPTWWPGKSELRVHRHWATFRTQCKIQCKIKTSSGQFLGCCSCYFIHSVMVGFDFSSVVGSTRGFFDLKAHMLSKLTVVTSHKLANHLK